MVFTTSTPGNSACKDTQDCGNRGRTSKEEVNSNYCEPNRVCQIVGNSKNE